MHSVNATFENVENDDASDNNFHATLKNDDNSVHATPKNVDTNDYNVHVTLTARGDNNVYTTLAKISNRVPVNLYHAEKGVHGASHGENAGFPTALPVNEIVITILLKTMITVFMESHL